MLSQDSRVQLSYRNVSQFAQKANILQKGLIPSMRMLTGVNLQPFVVKTYVWKWVNM